MRAGHGAHTKGGHQSSVFGAPFRLLWEGAFLGGIGARASVHLDNVHNALKGFGVGGVASDRSAGPAWVSADDGDSKVASQPIRARHT